MESDSKPLKGRTVVLAARKRSTLILNDLVAPVLVRAGARLLRFCHVAVPGSMEFAAGFRPLPREEVLSHEPDLIFSMDDYSVSWTGLDVPILSLPHATFQVPVTPLVMGSWQINISRTDFYFTQDDCTRYTDLAKRSVIYTARDIEAVTLVPLGSLKRDALARDLAACPHKDVIMVCGGHPRYPIPSWEDAGRFLEDLLKAYPQYMVVFRPFPDAVADAEPLKLKFREESRFILDTTTTTRTYMLRAAAVVCFASTTGEAYTLASGEPHVLVDTDALSPLTVREGALLCDGLRSALEAVEIILGKESEARERVERLREEIAGLVETLIYRPGHAEEILLETVRDIIGGRPPARSLSVPARSFKEQTRLNTHEGFHRLEELLVQPDFVPRGDNAVFSSMLLVSLYSVVRSLLPNQPARPRLIRIDKSRLGKDEEFVQALDAEDVPAETPVLVAGSGDQFTRTSLRWLESHPGGFLCPKKSGLTRDSSALSGSEDGQAERAADTSLLVLAALEMERPVLLLQDTSHDAFRQSCLLVLDMLRTLLDKKA